MVITIDELIAAKKKFEADVSTYINQRKAAFATETGIEIEKISIHPMTNSKWPDYATYATVDIYDQPARAVPLPSVRDKFP